SDQEESSVRGPPDPRSPPVKLPRKQNAEALEGLGLTAKSVGRTPSRPAKHTSPIPWTRVSVLVNGSPSIPPAAQATVWKIPVAPLWGNGTETLTSTLIAYRDLASIFMIRAVVKTWKTS